MELKKIDLLALQSSYMRKDRTTQALCAALSPCYQELDEAIRCIFIYPRIDKLSGAVLDELAWGFHVDAYDATASDMEKRRMIKSSFTVHKYKGSVYAVQEIVASVFGTQAKVIEWFQYNGDPFHFKVEVYCLDRGAGEDDIHRAEQLVLAGKNLRSVLDEIRLILVGIAQIAIAAAAIQSETITVYPIGGAS